LLPAGSMVRKSEAAGCLSLGNCRWLCINIIEKLEEKSHVR